MSSRTLVAALLLNTVTGSVLGAQSRSNKFVDFTLGSNFLVSSAPINGQYYRSGQGFGSCHSATNQTRIGRSSRRSTLERSPCWVATTRVS